MIDITEPLKESIKQLPFKPKGVKVSREIYDELMANGEITMKEDVLGHLPYMKDSICVHIEDSFNEFEFKLPSQP